MWQIALKLLAPAVAILLMGTSASPAASCSGHHKQCETYCETHHHNFVGCLSVCQNSFDNCKATGCWESPKSAKRCGYSRD